jgi:hypothetical protein
MVREEKAWQQPTRRTKRRRRFVMVDGIDGVASIDGDLFLGLDRHNKWR